MNPKQIIIIGSGGHAKVVIDILNQYHDYQIFGVTSNSLELGSTFFGCRVIGSDEILTTLNNNDYLIAMGIGGYRNNDLRIRLFKMIKQLGYRFINVIHPSAIISKSSVLGEGVVVFPGVVINTEVKIGNNSIIATGSTIDHESIIGDNVLISAGVTIGAYTEISDNCLVALGAKVISGVKVGQNSLIAAGAVVVNNINDGDIVFGVPAKKKFND